MLGTMDTGLASWIKRQKPRIYNTLVSESMGILGLFCAIFLKGCRDSVGNKFLHGATQNRESNPSVLEKLLSEIVQFYLEESGSNLMDTVCQVKSTNQQAGKINS